MLKYTPFKTNMNVSQHIAPQRLISTLLYQFTVMLYVEFHSSGQNSECKRDLYCGCGQCKGLRGRDLTTTYFSFIPKVTEHGCMEFYTQPQSTKQEFNVNGITTRSKRVGQGYEKAELFV